MNIGDKVTVNELVLHITNDYGMYSGIINSTLKLFARKIKNGTYNADKALIQWYTVATLGTKSYEREYMNKGEGCHIFTVAIRKAVAVELADYYQEELDDRVSEL